MGGQASFNLQVYDSNKIVVKNLLHEVGDRHSLLQVYFHPHQHMVDVGDAFDRCFAHRTAKNRRYRYPNALHNNPQQH